jgi:hypothetical protein
MGSAPKPQRETRKPVRPNLIFSMPGASLCNAPSYQQPALEGRIGRRGAASVPEPGSTGSGKRQYGTADFFLCCLPV